LLFVRGAYYHLWFLYALTGIYLILPVLRLMTKPGTDQKILWYLMGLWLIFQPGLSIARQFWGFSTRLSAPLTTGFIGCFILGYLLGAWVLSRLTVILSAIAWFLGTVATIMGTYWLTSQSGKFEGFFYDLISLNVIVASAGAFLFLRWFAETKLPASSAVRDAIRWLAAASFGIYLVHVLVIEILAGWIPGIHVDTFMGSPLWSVPLMTGIVFIVSFLIVAILQKIPVLNRIVP
jgi:surface polysaccharide O-acyltransferase-like enzyme